MVALGSYFEHARSSVTETKKASVRFVKEDWKCSFPGFIIVVCSLVLLFRELAAGMQYASYGLCVPCFDTVLRGRLVYHDPS